MKYNISSKAFLGVLVAAMLVATPSLAFASSTNIPLLFGRTAYSYSDSVLNLYGYVEGPYFSGEGANSVYNHQGYTYGTAYGNQPLSYVRVSLTSYDHADSGTCNIRNTDSGNVYGAFDTGVRSTSWATTNACVGNHTYNVNGTHWFGDSTANTSRVD